MSNTIDHKKQRRAMKLRAATMWRISAQIELDNAITVHPFGSPKARAKYRLGDLHEIRFEDHPRTREPVVVAYAFDSEMIDGGAFPPSSTGLVKVVVPAKGNARKWKAVQARMEEDARRAQIRSLIAAMAS